MGTIMNVYYGSDNLPYKDSARTVHYPIVGNSFTGASLVDEIRFYIDRIGSVAENTFVAIAKRADGKKGYKILESETDETINESYVSLQLSQWFTAKQGDLYISLNVYQGGVETEIDPETNLNILSGIPIIQATGSIKLSINYTPMMNENYGEVPTISVQEALGLITNKADISYVNQTLKEYVKDVEVTSIKTAQEVFDEVGGANHIFSFDLLGIKSLAMFVETDTDTYDLEIWNENGTRVVSPIDLTQLFRTELDNAVIQKTYLPVIALSSAMQTLTADELKIAEQDNSVINYNGRVYVKANETANAYEYVSADYDISTVGDNNQIIKYEISVNKTTGATSMVQQFYNAYTNIKIDELLYQKQDRLVSGTNIKTINGQSVLGSGDLEVGGSGGEWGSITGDIQDQTDLQNELQDIREVAEGKTNSFSVDTDTTGNSAFKSDDEVITATSFVDINGNTINVSDLNVGDLVFTLNTQTNKYKDRWLIDKTLGTWGLIDADTPNLSGYATKTELSESLENLAQPYDSSVIYSIGDKVIYNDKLYSCLVNMSVAESWDSTHWVQITVASGFVDLDKAQTITGVKTFSNGLFIGNTVNLYKQANTDNLILKIGQYDRYRFSGVTFEPILNNYYNLGSSTYGWKDLYLDGTAYIGDVSIVDSTNGLSSQFKYKGTTVFYISSSSFQVVKTLLPVGNQDIGSSAIRWQDLYLSRNLSDGTNSVTVAHLAQNTPTQWYGTQAEYDALGTYDSNTIYNILES